MQPSIALHGTWLFFRILVMQACPFPQTLCVIHPGCPMTVSCPRRLANLVELSRMCHLFGTVPRNDDLLFPWIHLVNRTTECLCFHDQERQRQLESMGISLETSGIKVGDDKCYLVNLNADPALNELLVYYLKVSRRVSDQQTSAIPHHSSGTWMPGLVPLLCVPSINLSRKAMDSAVPHHQSSKITSVSPLSTGCRGT